MKALAISVFSSLFSTYSFKEKKIFIHILDWCLSFQHYYFLIWSQLPCYFFTLILPSGLRWIKQFMLVITIWKVTRWKRKNIFFSFAIKSTMLTFKETANIKTGTNKNFTVKTHSARTLTKSSEASGILLTVELQQFQTKGLCNVCSTQQPNQQSYA